MRMARVNVYVPDELAEKAKVAGLNVSSLTQEAFAVPSLADLSTLSRHLARQSVQQSAT